MYPARLRWFDNIHVVLSIYNNRRLCVTLGKGSSTGNQRVVNGLAIKGGGGGGGGFVASNQQVVAS